MPPTSRSARVLKICLQVGVEAKKYCEVYEKKMLKIIAIINEGNQSIFCDGESNVCQSCLRSGLVHAAIFPLVYPKEFAQGSNVRAGSTSP